MSITGLVVAGGIGYLIGRGRKYPKPKNYHDPMLTVQRTVSDIISRKLYLKFLGREDPRDNPKVNFNDHIHFREYPKDRFNDLGEEYYDGV